MKLRNYNYYMKNFYFVIILVLLIGLAIFTYAKGLNKKGDSVVLDNDSRVLSSLKTTPIIKSVYFAGGCFWGVEEYFSRVDGVIDSVSGYANGKSENPSYEDVCYRNTGHSEAVKIDYNSAVVSLQELLVHLFRIIDPTSLNRQGNDRGTQYRTGIYYTDENQKSVALAFLKEMQKNYSSKIVVELEPIKQFFIAEDYHQDYLKKNPSGYCHINLSLASESIVDEDDYKIFDKSNLKDRLSDLEYRVTQEATTERPFSSEFTSSSEVGIYVDIVSGEPLFLSTDKFESGCGWPSFTKPISSDTMKYKNDNTLGMIRIEVRSRAADSHLGHVFDDGPVEQGGLRYCINGASLKFIPLSKMEELGYKNYIPLLSK